MSSLTKKEASYVILAMIAVYALLSIAWIAIVIAPPAIIAAAISSGTGVVTAVVVGVGVFFIPIAREELRELQEKKHEHIKY